jgi:hypothetical protein
VPNYVRSVERWLAAAGVPVPAMVPGRGAKVNA